MRNEVLRSYWTKRTSSVAGGKVSVRCGGVRSRHTDAHGTGKALVHAFRHLAADTVWLMLHASLELPSKPHDFVFILRTCVIIKAADLVFR